jgi:hypothetical protein
VEARLEAHDLYVAASALLPDGMVEPKPDRPAEPSRRFPRACPFSVYPIARVVALDAASSKAPLSASSAPSPAKGEGEHRLPHLVSQDPALELATQPGP